MHSSKGGNSQKHLVQLSAAIAQGEKAIEFEQHRIFQELKSVQHVEINQYQTVMAIMTSNMKLYIYDALTKNQLCEMNLQEFIKIENSVKQSALGKSGDVIMRFLKNTNFLSVYLKNSGDFLVLKIGGSNGARVVQRMQLQEKLSFMEMDPCSKNGFIFGSRGIDMGNLKTQKITNIEQGSCTEVRIVESSEDMDEEIDEESSSTDKLEINEEDEEKAEIEQEEDEDELENGSEGKQDNKNKEQEEDDDESEEDSNNNNILSEKDNNSDEDGEDNSNPSGQDKLDYVVEGLKKQEDNVIENEIDDGNDEDEDGEDNNQEDDDDNEEDGQQEAESNRSICKNSEESEILNTNEEVSDKDEDGNQKIGIKSNKKDDSKASKKPQKKQNIENKPKQNKQTGKKIKGRATPPQQSDQYDQNGQKNKIQENIDEDYSYQTNSPRLQKKVKPNNNIITPAPLGANSIENKITNNTINNGASKDIAQTKDTSKSKNIPQSVVPPVELSNSNKQGDNSAKVMKNISSNTFSNKINTVNASQQGSSRTQANNGINLEKVETKLLDSSSVALYLRDRCSKNRKIILGMVNRRIVIYEVTITESDVEIQLINKLELSELHMYDMSVLQLSLNLQNDKFALAIDRKFLHLFSLDSTYHIATFSEDYINIDQNKRYSNPLFWRDPYEKDKPEYFLYMDNTNLNCSIVLTSLRTAKTQIVILKADKPRNVFQNVRWEGCIGVVGEGGGLFVLESPRQYYWENFSYRFKGLEKNSQYIEREDEFDVKDQSAQQMKVLTLDDFDNLKTNYTNYLYPQQNKIISQGTIVMN